MGASLEHYQPLRVMLTTINSRHTALAPEQHEALDDAVEQLSSIEESVYGSYRVGIEAERVLNFYRTLNAIQADLEEIASSTHFDDSGAGE